MGTLIILAALSSVACCITWLFAFPGCKPEIRSDNANARHRLYRLVVEEFQELTMRTVQVVITQGTGINGSVCRDEDGVVVIRVSEGAALNLSDLALRGLLAHEMAHELHGDTLRSARGLPFLRAVGKAALYGGIVFVSVVLTGLFTEMPEGALSLSACLLFVPLAFFCPAILLDLAMCRLQEYRADWKAEQLVSGGMVALLEEMAALAVKKTMYNRATPPSWWRRPVYLVSSLRSTHPAHWQRLRAIRWAASLVPAWSAISAVAVYVGRASKYS